MRWENNKKVTGNLQQQHSQKPAGNRTVEQQVDAQRSRNSSPTLCINSIIVVFHTVVEQSIKTKDTVAVAKTSGSW